MAVFGGRISHPSFYILISCNKMFIFNPQREREREHSDAYILPIKSQSITSPKTKFKAKKSKEKLEGKKSY